MDRQVTKGLGVHAGLGRTSGEPAFADLELLKKSLRLSAEICAVNSTVIDDMIVRLTAAFSDDGGYLTAPRISSVVAAAIETVNAERLENSPAPRLAAVISTGAALMASVITAGILALLRH